MTPNLHMASGGTIAGLGFDCGPMAVVQGVIAIVVDTVNRVKYRWLWPHVSQKVLKAVKPAVADFDPPSPISGVFMILWVKASSFHRGPRSVFRRPALPVEMLACKTVDGQVFGSVLRLQTSATEFGLSDVGSCSYSGIAAVTSALPHCISGALNMGPANNSQSPEALASQINKCSHIPFRSLIDVGE